MASVTDHKPPISNAIPPGLGQRLRLLVLCLTLGFAAGLLGHWLSGRAEWFLAIPFAVALGWLLVADPSQCATCQGKDRNLL